MNERTERSRRGPSMLGYRRYERGIWTWAHYLLAAGLLGTPLATRAVAQEGPQPYKTASKAISDARQLAQLRAKAFGAVGGPLDEAGKELLRQYIGLGIFANMTRPESLEDPQQIPRWRTELIQFLLRASRRPEDHRFVRDLVFTFAKQLASGPYHPACRYNAVLIIGELNERELQRSGTSVTPPVPFGAARDFLLQLLQDGQTPEELHIAALIGLKRHTAALVAQGQMDDRILAVARGIVQTLTPPEGRSPAAHYWKQRLAVEILGTAGQSEDAQRIVSVLKNSDAPTSLRCSAAEALGQLDYSKGSVDALPLVKAISQFTLENVQETVQWFQDEVARLPDDPTASGRRFESLEGSTAQQEADPLVVRTRRQMGYVLWCSSRGLAGILRGTSDATQKQAITAIGKQMQTVLKALNDGGETVTPRELLNKIGPPAVRLEQMVKSL